MLKRYPEKKDKLDAMIELVKTENGYYAKGKIDGINETINLFTQEILKRSEVERIEKILMEYPFSSSEELAQRLSNLFREGTE